MRLAAKPRRAAHERRNNKAVLDLNDTSSVGSADTFPSRGRLYAHIKSAERLSEKLSQ